MKKAVFTLFCGFPGTWLILILIAASVGVACPHTLAWFWILAVYAVGSFLFNVGRQIYWRITKTGDYAYLQKSSKAVPGDPEAGTD